MGIMEARHSSCQFIIVSNIVEYCKCIHYCVHTHIYNIYAYNLRESLLFKNSFVTSRNICVYYSCIYIVHIHTQYANSSSKFTKSLHFSQHNEILFCVPNVQNILCQYFTMNY